MIRPCTARNNKYFYDKPDRRKGADRYATFMKEIKSHNKKNKEAIAKAIEVLFKPDNEIQDYIKKMLLERLLWATTEHTDDGKYKKYIGQPFWSVGAIKKLLDNLANGRKLEDGLIHEHSVPKKEIKSRIMNLEDKSKDKILEILDNLGHAVVVSKDEDEKINKKGYKSKMPLKLPTNPNIDEVFSRYKEAQIKICHIENREIKSMTIEDIEKHCI